MKYGECFMKLEYKDKNKKPLTEFTTWRGDFIMKVLCAVVKFFPVKADDLKEGASLNITVTKAPKREWSDDS